MSKNKWCGLVCFMMIAAVLAGCGRQKEVRLTVDQLDGILEMNKGQTLVIELPANPSTGYAWEAENLDAAIFEPVGETEFIREQSDKAFVGAPETQIIRLKAIGSGETRLTLIYHRSFEQGVDPLETHHLDVSVR